MYTEYLYWINLRENKFEKKKLENEYFETSLTLEPECFAYFVCTINNVGYVRRVRAIVLESSSELKKHACQKVIDHVLNVLSKHSEIKASLEEKLIDFSFDMMGTENDPCQDNSDSLGAALVAAVINKLMSPLNCNFFVATGALLEDGQFGKVSNVRLKALAAASSGLRIALPKSNEEESAGSNFEFECIENIDSLLTLGRRKICER